MHRLYIICESRVLFFFFFFCKYWNFGNFGYPDMNGWKLIKGGRVSWLSNLRFDLRLNKLIIGVSLTILK